MRFKPEIKEEHKAECYRLRCPIASFIGNRQDAFQGGRSDQARTTGAKQNSFHNIPLTDEHQKQALESAEREQQELTRTQLQALSAPSKSRWNANTNKADEISGLEDWEVTALKKIFQSLEQPKNRCVPK